MKITDSITLDASGLTLTKDGYLVGEARVARAFNVQQYRGSELGLTGDNAAKMFGVYRDPDVVFDEASMLSLAGRPVTRGHPPAGVSAQSWKDLAVGQMGGVIRRDGEHVVAPMAIMDAVAAQEVLAGARSLSAGYTVDVVADEGIAADGTAYQFRQAGALRFNHVAYLPDNNPRAGNTRVGDGAPQKEEHTMTLKTVTVDGIPIEVTDQGAAVIATLQSRLATADATIAAKDKAIADANAAHAAAIAAKDGELAKKDAAIDAEKAKVVDAAALDKLVASRANLVTVAKAIAKDVKTDGLSDADIRKAVVVAKLGDAAVKDKAPAYIDARFEILAEDATKAAGGPDAVRNAITSGLQTDAAADKAVTDARAAMLADMHGAHQPAKSAA